MSLETLVHIRLKAPNPNHKMAFSFLIVKGILETGQAVREYGGWGIHGEECIGEGLGQPECLSYFYRG